jgi:hypothetical protein
MKGSFVVGNPWEEGTRSLFNITAPDALEKLKLELPNLEEAVKAFKTPYNDNDRHIHLVRSLSS